MKDNDEMWLKRVMQDPQDYFDSAKALLEDDNIVDEHKLAILKNWKDQLAHRLGSDAENMCQDDTGTEDEVQLQEVSAAISQINTH